MQTIINYLTIILLTLSACFIGYKSISLPIQVDELCELGRLNNTCFYRSADRFKIDIQENFSNRVIKLADLDQIINKTQNTDNLLSNLSYYINNYQKITNHPPVAALLNKIIFKITGLEHNIANLRVISFMWGLLACYLCFLLSRNLFPGSTVFQHVMSSLILLNLNIFQTFMSFAKPYTLTLCLYLASILILHKLLSLNKFQPQYFILSLMSLHFCFNTHYLSIIPLITTSIFLVIKKLIQEKTLNTYKPIIPNILQLISIFLSLAIYLPNFMTQQSFTKALSFHYQPLKSFIYFPTKILNSTFLFNIQDSIISLLIIGIIVFLYINTNKLDQENIKQILVFIFIYFIVSLVFELATQTSFSKTIRYHVFLLPFSAIFWANLITKHNLSKGFIILAALSPLILSPQIKYLNTSINYEKQIEQISQQVINRIIQADMYQQKTKILVNDLHCRTILLLNTIKNKMPKDIDLNNISFISADNISLINQNPHNHWILIERKWQKFSLNIF